MKDILEKLKSMNKAELNEAVKQAKDFAATDAGKELVEKIKKGEGIQQLGIDSAKQKEMMQELNSNSSIAKLIFDVLNGKG
ncbi:MAG: hypothetical protein E7392_02280 [Ruminococcaceae bacterium]|nr:hypothetical protein [Oscillospiraceae bacterium]